MFVTAPQVRSKIDVFLPVEAGAKALIPDHLFPQAKQSVDSFIKTFFSAYYSPRGTTYVAPQVLVDVNHGM